MAQEERCRCSSASLPPLGDDERVCGTADMWYSGGPNVPQYSTESVQKVRLGGSRPTQSPTRGKSTATISSRKWRALRGRGIRGASGVLGGEAQEKVRVDSGRA